MHREEMSTVRECQALSTSEGAFNNYGYPRGFPGGSVVKNPPASAGGTGSSPGPGRSHMPGSN